MLSEAKKLKTSKGFIHFIPLLILAAAVLTSLIILPKKNLNESLAKSDVLSEEQSESEEVDEDNDKPEPTEIDDDNLDEDENEIEELEFEDDENEDENETEEERLVGGDIRQKVEIESENGTIKIKIKTKTLAGREVEEELEATTSATIASLNLKIQNGEIKLKVKSENGKIVLVEEVGGEETQALTDLPITIDSENNLVIIHTPSGNVNLTEFPAEILSALLASENLDTLKKLELKVKTEEGKTKLVYHAQGENEVKFLGMFKFKTEVEADVDPITGNQQIVSQPWYLKYLSFLFFVS